MATLALAAAGAAAGSALMPAGLSVLGASISGATIGAQVGALAGAFVDQALFGASGQSRTVAGPRLSDLHVTASSESAPIPRVYGRARLGGQVIWATDFEEEVVTTEAGGGGKGGSRSADTVTRTDYRYYANFAVALCAGEIAGVGRIWADGEELDLAGVTWRLHKGGEAQLADSLIAAHEGADAPAYRGVAYVVFEHLPLAPYGNRLPQLSFEVFRGGDAFSRLVRAVVLIPGSGEFFAATSPVTRIGFAGEQVAENMHARSGLTDAAASIAQLRATLPNVGAVSLVSAWFGTDLRCGACQIVPKVERSQKDTAPLEWSVAGLSRAAAPVVSQRLGRAAYGGTPSDQTLVDQIRSLAGAGLAVTLNPFILMDVPEGNALPNPLDGTGTQPAYPWRGRITCDPAPGRPGSADKTATASAQLASFIGTAAPGNFSLSGDTVVYSGPQEWSYRRFILHHAWLAKAAGGVTAFLIGSEMRGVSTVRGTGNSFPFVAAMAVLAADVKSILGPGVKVTYAADWSEYFGHQPQDGSGDVFFHLDPLWASSAIDAIGIDLYWPLSDWRDGADHLDRQAGVRHPYDLDYLKSNIAGGEGFDWYYASEADRRAQLRTPITDGAGKPWVFRYKDVRSWWQNHHYDRPGGIESGTATAWQPRSKPFWIMELGSGAVDKAANQPNVFVDPKSAESSLPYFSSGRRDDLMQRRYLQALLEAFDPQSGRAVPDLNPLSPVYGGAMIDVAYSHVYAWDLRPYPAFPADIETWSDGDNWRLGHWLNGRAASISLDTLVGQILTDCGFERFDASRLVGLVPGYVVDRIMPPRDALQPLELAYFFDSVESGGTIRMRHRGDSEPVAIVDGDVSVETRPGAPLITLVRGQETDLPASAKITFLSSEGDYRQAVAEARRLAGASGRVAQADLPLVLDPEAGAELSESWLFESWSSRERASLSLPPSRIAIEPGDTFVVADGGRHRLFRATEIGQQIARTIEARSFDPDVYARPAQAPRPQRPPAPQPSGQPAVLFLDLPLLPGDATGTAGYIAAAQRPWPGALAVYRSPEATGFTLQATVTAASAIGETLDPLPAGPEGRIDRATRLRVRLATGHTASSVTRTRMLSGANMAAVRNRAGQWEVLQYETALLVAPSTYELSNLLRGQGGTETAMTSAPLPAGAPVVLLGPGLTRLPLAAGEIALPFTWRVRASARDLGSNQYVQVSHAFAGLGLRPVSPVHVRATRSAGDITIRWKRRTRLDGDGWNATEVPLGEEREAYEVDVMDGATVKRTLAVSEPVALYDAAAQIADFGALQTSLTVRVTQLSAAWGRGAARTATI